MGELVMAAHRWPTNAAMIVDVQRLGYLPGRVLDPTYGRGRWWTDWQPDELITHDLKLDGVDFRDLPHRTGEFDSAVFDPPYVALGGRRTSTVGDFNDRYGLHSTPRRPEDLHEQLLAPGLTEVARTVAVGGYVSMKCKDYINGRRFRPHVRWICNHAEAIGLTQVDQLEHITGTGPQSQITQEHARRNHSTLLVWRVDQDRAQIEGQGDLFDEGAA